MGVCAILQWNHKHNESAVQAEEGLLNHLGGLGAKGMTHWTIGCEHYTAVPSIPSTSGRSFQVIRSSEQDQLDFAITDQGTCLVAERSFDLLLTKLSDMYQPNKIGTVEVKGKRCEIGDFAIKVGSLFIGNNFKCLLLEVEYMPSCHRNETLPLLHEFLSLVCVGRIPVPENIGTLVPVSNTNGFYQLSDTIMQYWRIFNECRHPGGGRM